MEKTLNFLKSLSPDQFENFDTLFNEIEKEEEADERKLVKVVYKGMKRQDHNGNEHDRYVSLQMLSDKECEDFKTYIGKVHGEYTLSSIEPWENDEEVIHHIMVPYKERDDSLRDPNKKYAE